MRTITWRSGPGQLRAALAAMAAAGVLTACGTSANGGPVGATTASGNASPIALSKCMRANGLPNFPDPQFPSGGGVGPPVVRKVVPNRSAPALQKAAQACGRGGQIRISAAP